MEFTELFTVGLILLICYYFIISTWKELYRKKGLPPGPTPLPLIGNLLNIKIGSLVNSLIKTSEQYGSVYTMYFGSNPVVVICGYEAIKEALIDQNDDFGERGKLPTIDQITKGYGITFATGERWKIIRTFTFKTLRNFGFGKRSSEWKIQEEARYVVEEFRKSQEHPLSPSRYFMEALNNILCSIMFGDRFDYTDVRFSKLLSFAEEVFKLTSSPWGQAHSIFPTLMNYIPGPHQRVVSVSEELVKHLAEIVNSCQETLDPSQPRHFVDCFLIRMEKEKDNHDTEFTMINLLYTIHNVFLGGADSVNSMLKHALLLLLTHPEIGDKLYDENGKFKKNEAFLAFSAGKRMCPGEAVALMEMFIFIPTILQNFKLTSETEFSEADMAPKLEGFLNTPIEYELSFIPR